jgi:hypothetical protein
MEHPFQRKVPCGSLERANAEKERPSEALYCVYSLQFNPDIDWPFTAFGAVGWPVGDDTLFAPVPRLDGSWCHMFLLPGLFRTVLRDLSEVVDAVTIPCGRATLFAKLDKVFASF